MNLNQDQPHRVYRLIEVLADRELKQSRLGWPLVDGWLETAEQRDPGTPKALLEGDFIVELTDGSRFKEVSFKSEHKSVGESLADWASSVGRRWAYYADGVIHLSNGVHVAECDCKLSKC